MDAHWAFLQPWLEALQAVLVRPVEVPQRPDEHRFACATFGCWPSPWDVAAAVTGCTLDVQFPADQASRQDSDSLQQMREAVAIFDTLAAVDNAAFVAALSGYMRPRQLQDGSPRAVWPQWRFSLGGFLSADDAVTKAPFVTWGQVFGSPTDPWQHSPGFYDAMERLHGEVVGLVGSHRNSNAWIEWEIHVEVMSISGNQELKPTKRKFSPLSDELGKLLMLEAPPVFVMESVSDSIALIKTWQADPIARHVGIQSEVGKTAVFRAKYDASGIGEVAAGLAQTTMLDIGLIDLTEEHVSAIEVVLKYSYPQPTEPSTPPPHSQYGCTNIRAGTELRSVGLRAGDDTVLVASQDLRCRAHYKPSSKQLDVVVPGYGICTMPNVDVFESDDVVGSPSGFLGTANTSCGVRSLSVSFAAIENDHLLLRFLALIGGRLRTLTLRYSGVLRRSVGLDLRAVAAACPALQTLRVDDFQVTFSSDNDALRNWKVKKLDIGGSNVNGLIRMLDDPTYRTSRELVELRLGLGRMWDEPWDQYRFTLDYLKALQAHNEEFLPVVKEKFPLRSKISLISVVSCRRAGRFLDSSMLSIMFAFAAIPEQRRVVIS